MKSATDLADAATDAPGIENPTCEYSFVTWRFFNSYASIAAMTDNEQLSLLEQLHEALGRHSEPKTPKPSQEATRYIPACKDTGRPMMCSATELVRCDGCGEPFTRRDYGIFCPQAAILL